MIPFAHPTLLIMPIQRIPRYKLLFEDLLRRTPATHPDFENLCKCGPDLDKLNSVGAKIYNDMRIGWTVEDGRTAEFYMGVDNLFDVKPPFLPSGFASPLTGTETAADTYDPFGRAFYAGVNIKF